MPHLMKVYLAVIPLFLAVDFLWLGLVANGFYKNQLGSLLRTSGSDMAPLWWAVAGVYLVIPLGIVLFALPPAGSTVLQAALRGLVYGIVLYLVYELTNLALVRDWPLAMAVVDVAWGGFICSLTATAAFVVSGKLG
jgi:uncharacterized membrane protein